MQIGEQAIRDTVARVFSAPEYNASSSPVGKAFHWVWEQLGRLLAALGRLLPSRAESPALFWLSVILLAAVVLAAAGGATWRWRRRRIARAAAARVHGDEASVTAHADPWRAAQRLAADGAFTDAAHALYQALLQGAARQGQLRLHPSKTVGDYVRELRGRSSTLLDRFRAFARSYEVIVYGLGTCDQERYERLRLLAADILQPHG